MTDYGELVRRGKTYLTRLGVSHYNGEAFVVDQAGLPEFVRDAVNAIEQLERELAQWKESYDKRISNMWDVNDAMRKELEACEGALRNSGNIAREQNDLALRYQSENTRLQGIIEALKMVTCAPEPTDRNKGLTWDDEPDERVTGYPGEVDCG